MEVKYSICGMCTTGRCTTKVEVDGGRARSIEVLGVSCPRGQRQLEFQYSPHRLTKPLRRNGPRGSGIFTPVEWDVALSEIAESVDRLARGHGAESIGFYVGYPKEPRPYLQRLAHALGSPNFMTESSVCATATRIAGAVTFGAEYQDFLSDGPIEQETSCLVLWGTNPAVSAPETWLDILKSQERGVNVIAIDPRQTESTEIADLHLRPRPGTDGALALGWLHLIFRDNLIDQNFCDNYVYGVDSLAKYVTSFTPSRVESITGVPQDDLLEAVRLYAQGRSHIRISADTLVHQSNGVQNTRAVLLIIALSGNLDVPGGNSPTRKPVLRDITLFSDRIDALPPRLGVDRYPVFTSIVPQAHAACLPDAVVEGSPYPLRALICVGLNMMMWPNSKRMADALRKLDLLVVSDYFPTPTTAFADYVLPSATWLERPGLVSGPGLRLRYREAVLPATGEARSDAWWIFELAKKLGLSNLFWEGSLEEAFQEQLSLIGIELDELQKNPEGVVVETSSQASIRMYEQRGFSTPTGKVECSSKILESYGFDGLPVYKEPVRSPYSSPELADSFPLVLCTGTRHKAFTHSQHRSIKELLELSPKPAVAVHPGDAVAREIKDGEEVSVRTDKGEVIMVAHVDDKVLPGMVVAPHGWAHANINEILSAELDPISGFPAFKAQLCDLTTVQKLES